MKQTLQLKIGQQLTMTPQLQQAIRLLQLSSLDLRQEIQEALYSNPMLELAEEHSSEETGSAEKNREAETDESRTKNGSDEADETWNENIPNELSVDADWEDVFQTSSMGSRQSQRQSSGSEGYDIEKFHVVTESLQDHLLWQLNLTPMSALDELVAKALIDTIDDDGMLTSTPEEIVESLKIEELEVDEVVTVLHRIQQFDPPGVGARDLAECLSIQLDQLDGETPHLKGAKLIARSHLEDLARQDFRKIQQRTGLAKGEIMEAVTLIQSLNPRPGNAVSTSAPDYVVPDARVIKVNGRWVVTLNSDISPQLSINNVYAAMVKRADSSRENQFLKNNLQEAKWFLRSLESRNETLLKVCTAIINMQQDFLDAGPEAMRPMILADVADRLDLHESTVSRVTTLKYIDTPQGVFELKYFFSSHVSTSSGGEASSTAIRAMLKKLIESENSAKPLSDNRLATLLQEQGIEIARRTVAKYREGMGIPSSSERKRYKQFQ